MRARHSIAPIGLRARRKARKREEILRAGLKVFAEKGYHGATMDDIALELEATKGLLYYHFKTKEEILSGILAENQLIAGIEAGLSVPQDLRVSEALPMVVGRALDLMDASGELVRFLHIQALLSGREAEFVYTRVLDRLYEQSARWIEAFKRSGEVRADLDARTFGRLMVDFITVYFLQKQIFGSGVQPPREYVNGVLEIFLKGIATERVTVDRQKADADRIGLGGARKSSC